MGQHGVNVNAICPGVVQTDMASQLGPPSPEALKAIKQRIPIGRLLQPEEIPPLAVYLASSESEGMTGQSILLDGGMLFV